MVVTVSTGLVMIINHNLNNTDSLDYYRLLSYPPYISCCSGGCSSSSSSSSSTDDVILDDCGICLQPCCDRISPCCHSFCRDCVRQWWQHQHCHGNEEKRCPICATTTTAFLLNVQSSVDWREELVDVPLLIDGSSLSFPMVLSHGHNMRRIVYMRRNLTPELKVENKIKSPNLNYLKLWVTRELQAIFRKQDVDVLVELCLGIVKRDEHVIKNNSDVFYTALEPFLMADTKIFITECRCFIYSGYSVESYDTSVRYVISNDYV